MDKMEIIKNISSRTGGEIYLGVVGGVRTCLLYTSDAADDS